MGKQGLLQKLGVFGKSVGRNLEKKILPYAVAGVLGAGVLMFSSCEKEYQDSNGEWQLIWYDEFDYPNRIFPHPNKWTYEIGYVRNNELQYYRKNNVFNTRRVDEYLILEAHKEEYKGHGYTSASITTKGLHSWTYGKFEVKAKLPTGTGTWPAIWLYGPNDYYPGEIDIMENVGYDPQRVHSYVHTKCSRVGNSFKLSKPWNDFHVYSIEWFPDRIHFFVDENLHLSVYEKDFKHWPFNEPHYLIINLAIGGRWGGRKGIDDTIFPQQFVIDHVKVYEFVNQ